MTRITKRIASDRGTRLLNLQLRGLEEDPRAANDSYIHIIRTMHTELMHLSTENLDLKYELDMAAKSTRKLSRQLAEQEDLQAAKEEHKAWALATVRRMCTKLEMAHRNIRLKKEHNEQLHKYAINHTTPATTTASNSGEDM